MFHRPLLHIKSTRIYFSARISSALLGLFLSAACSVPVAGNLDETGANRVVVALEEQGVAATKQPDPAHEGQFQVSVNQAEASGAIGILAHSNLPAKPTPGVLDSLGQGSLVPSRSSEHARLVAGITGELERSLQEIDGVLSARVHLAVVPKDALKLSSKSPAPTASVLLRHRSANSPIATEEIQRLVAGAVPELEPSAVAVVTTSVPKPAPAEARELARFGPITTTRSSLTPLRIGAIIVLLAGLSSVSLLAFLSRRLRRAQHELVTLRQYLPGDGEPRGANS